ncbi:MAG TPA: hypothetical protein VMU98_07840 [Acidimicrobiales bacterium]|nr:hypothetical protein [Acidimicrobiales bacterium]
MKRFLSAVALGAMVMTSVGALGASVASAAPSATTVTLSGGKAIVGQPPALITATASAPGTVSFSAAGSVLSGCNAVATATVTPFVATCPWAPTNAGTVALGATFTPTDATTYASAVAPAFNAVVAVPVQNVVAASPIPLYVDTIVASGHYAAGIAPIYGGCQITNEFLAGQTIVFRAFGYDASGNALTPANVSSATVTIQGVATPLTMSFANHGASSQPGGIGAAFWTAPLATGGTNYSTLGLIPYTVTFKTIAVPAVTKKVPATKWVLVKKNGKKVMLNGQAVYRAVKYQKTVIVTPAVAGATGTFTPNFNVNSSATLNAAPAA